jgi:putative hydrolase of the HAD superfamily
MLPETKAIFFDAVGTLLFPSPPATQIYSEIARRKGLDQPEEETRRRFHTAFQLQEEIDRHQGWITSEQRERERWFTIVTESLPGIGNDGFEELYLHFAQPSAWRVHPEAGAVLKELARRKIFPGMASNYDSRLLKVVAGIPELAPLETVVVSSLVGSRKPGAAFFAEVIQRAGCLPGEIMFVGDDPVNDYSGANDAGLVGILIDPEVRHPGCQRIQSLLELI